MFSDGYTDLNLTENAILKTTKMFANVKKKGREFRIFRTLNLHR